MTEARVERLLRHVEADVDGKRCVAALAKVINAFGFHEMKTAGQPQNPMNGMIHTGLRVVRINHIFTCSATVTLDDGATVDSIRTFSQDDNSNAIVHPDGVASMPQPQVVPPKSQSAHMLKYIDDSDPTLPTVWVHNSVLSNGSFNGVWMSGQSSLVNVKCNFLILDGLPDPVKPAPTTNGFTNASDASRQGTL